MVGRTDDREKPNKGEQFLCGYGKTHRLTGIITEFMTTKHPNCLPGWVACYGTDNGEAALIRIEVDRSPNATGSPTGADNQGAQNGH